MVKLIWESQWSTLMSFGISPRSLWLCGLYREKERWREGKREVREDREKRERERERERQRKRKLCLQTYFSV